MLNAGNSPHDDAIHNVSYHKPKHSETQDLMEQIRKGAQEFITVITNNTAYNRETQMAYRAIEDAVMYAIAGLARNEEESLANLRERGKL